MLLCRDRSDIERTYGERKPIAARTPLRLASRVPLPPPSVTSTVSESTGTTTPDAKEGNQARSEGKKGPESEHSDSSFDLLLTDDSSEGDEKKPSNGSAVGKDGRQREGSISTVQAVANVKEKEQQQVPLTRHDLDVKYFRKDLVLFKNLDLFRWVPNLASLDVGLNGSSFGSFPITVGLETSRSP